MPGSRLPRRWAWAVPLAAMVLSDIVLDYGSSPARLRAHTLDRLCHPRRDAWLGLFARQPEDPSVDAAADSRWPVRSLFFVTTNFATWAEGQEYPLTARGTRPLLREGPRVPQVHDRGRTCSGRRPVRPRADRRADGGAALASRCRERGEDSESRRTRLNGQGPCCSSASDPRKKPERPSPAARRSSMSRSRPEDHWGWLRVASGDACATWFPSTIKVSVALGELVEWLGPDRTAIPERGLERDRSPQDRAGRTPGRHGASDWGQLRSQFAGAVRRGPRRPPGLGRRRLSRLGGGAGARSDVDHRRGREARRVSGHPVRHLGQVASRRIRRGGEALDRPGEGGGPIRRAGRLAR